MDEFFAEQQQCLKKEDRPVTMAFIRAMAKRSVSLLGSPPPLGGVVEAVLVSKALIDRRGRRQNPELPPVNGFYYDDLSTALDAARRGEPSGLLTAYLRDERGESRRDCLRPQEIRRALDLARLPDGSWPSEFRLTLMQQVAVNEGIARLPVFHQWTAGHRQDDAAARYRRRGGGRARAPDGGLPIAH